LRQLDRVQHREQRRDRRGRPCPCASDSWT
jgi:hypothetical protein